MAHGLGNGRPCQKNSYFFYIKEGEAHAQFTLKSSLLILFHVPYALKQLGVLGLTHSSADKGNVHATLS